MKIIEVHSIQEDLDGAFSVDLTYVDAVGDMEKELIAALTRDSYIYRESDPYGLSPLIKEWIIENDPEILPYEPPPLPTPEKTRKNLPKLSMVDFRRKLRGIKVVERDGEAELDGIYEEDILEKIAIISDKELQAEARDYFMFAQYIERINPWVEILGGMFDITPEEIDTFWMN